MANDETTATTQNARIERTFLGIQDHGMLVVVLEMDYGDGSGQGYVRILGDRAHLMLRNLLEVLGVDSWEKVQGSYCRVRRRSRSSMDTITQIGHITRDVWSTYDGE